MTLIAHEEAGASGAEQSLVCEKPPAGISIDEIVSAELPVLDSTIVCGALVVPTRWVANVNEVAEKEACGAKPVPESATVWFEAGAPTLIVRLPETSPREVGAKVTLIAQLAPAASEAPQVLLCANGEVVTIAVIESVASPVFDSVSVCDGLVVPTNCELKVRFAGLTEATGAMPVPVKVTVAGLLGAFVDTASAPEILPRPLGVKVTLMLQLAAAGSDVPQVLVCANGLVADIELMLRGAVPLFVKTTDCDGLEVPVN